MSLIGFTDQTEGIYNWIINFFLVIITGGDSDSQEPKQEDGFFSSLKNKIFG